MRRGRGFTLVELLMVIAIISILAAMFMPIIKLAKGAAYSYVASSNLSQLGTATSLYVADHDEVYMPALYWDGAWQGWYGRHLPDGSCDPKQGLLASYTKGHAFKDPIYKGESYFGDGSGFGYNWGYVGGDMDVTGDYRWFPLSTNPAAMSQIESSSKTIGFGTSAFYYAKWMPRGNGKVYDYGFISAPKFWEGNPDVDFRHLGGRHVFEGSKQITSDGRALFVFLDSHTKSMQVATVKDEMFQRGTPAQ